MKKLNQNNLVEFNQELQNMVEYTINIWDGNQESLIKAVTEGFVAGYAAGDKWIDQYAFTDFIIEWMDTREKLGNKSDMTIYDDVTLVAKNIMFHSSSLRQLILHDWDYEKNTRKITSSVKSSLYDSKIFPKGWEKIKDSGKSAFEYFEHFNLDEDKQFKGYDSTSAGASGFNERVNLANTFYNDSEQGRSPLYNLVSSAFSHGLTMREHNNTVELFNEIKKIKSYFDKPEFNKPVFIEDIQSLSENKFFKALMINKYSTKIKREYESQIELEEYIKEKNENKNIYGMVKFNMTGSDDYNYQGFKVQKIYQLNHFEEQLKEKVKSWFEGKNYKDLYYSDNNFGPVEKDEILSSLSFKQVSQKEFVILQKLLNSSGKSVSYGQHENFMDYDYPSTKEILAINTKNMNTLMDEIKAEETEPQAIATREERENAYKKTVYSVLGIKQSNKNKPK